jgi:hypothetical protein
MVEGAETEEAGMECRLNSGEGTGGTDHIHILCCNQRPAVPGVQDPDKIIICNDVKNIVVSWMAKMTMPSLRRWLFCRHDELLCGEGWVRQWIKITPTWAVQQGFPRYLILNQEEERV